MGNKNNFDLLGLYPKPIADMSSSELLFSSAITTFFIFGLIMAVKIFFQDPSQFLWSFVTTLLFIFGVYLGLSALRRRMIFGALKKQRDDFLNYVSTQSMYNDFRLDTPSVQRERKFMSSNKK